MQDFRMRIRGLVLCAGIVLSGCSTPNRHPSTNAPLEWQGRISVQVLGHSPSSMSANFLLRGNTKNGELNLYSPLGTTIGVLTWTPQQVQLYDGNKQQYFNSLAELTEQTTGAALPIDAIFAWLQGHSNSTEGWQTDLSAASQGSVTARRIMPQPEVTLRIKLDQ